MRFVADSLVLRWFCRIYLQGVPDAGTLDRLAQTIRPESMQRLNDRVVALAQLLDVLADQRREAGEIERLEGLLGRQIVTSVS